MGEKKEFVTLYLASGNRYLLLSGYNFYVEQAKKLIFSQFSDLESAANKYIDEWYSKAGKAFDPENYDPADVAEQAHEEGIDFYLSLEEMKSNVYLAILSSIYHKWEKDLREWLVKEIRNWTKNEVIYKKIWALSLPDIIELIESLGVSVSNIPTHPKLLTMSKVVNVFKHGDGNSFETLKASSPEYFRRDGVFDEVWGNDYIRYEDLTISEVQFDEFIESIIEFWNNIPEYTYSNQAAEILPAWFEKLL